MAHQTAADLGFHGMKRLGVFILPHFLKDAVHRRVAPKHLIRRYSFICLAPVVQSVDSAIHRINHFPVDSVVCFANTYLYPVDSAIHSLNNWGLDGERHRRDRTTPPARARTRTTAIQSPAHRPLDHIRMGHKHVLVRLKYN